MILNANDIILIFWIILLQMLENFQFNTSLMLEFLFIPYEFNSYYFLSLMIKTLYSLSEASLT